MTQYNSSYTGRASRSMKSAFGPYTSDQLSEPDRPFDWQDKTVLAGCVVAVVFVFLMGVL